MDDLEEINMNKMNEFRRRAGLPINEGSEELDEMVKVLQALKGAYMSLNQVKMDLEEKMLVNRMGQSNDEYINATITDQLAAVHECMNRYSKTVKDHTAGEEKEFNAVRDTNNDMIENASGSASAAGSIASTTSVRNTSAFADKARKDKKNGKKTETIFALSED